jgi:ABC-type phosphonate transport system ATPase subunit
MTPPGVEGDKNQQAGRNLLPYPRLFFMDKVTGSKQKNR